MPDREIGRLNPPKATEALCRNVVETTFDDLSEWNIKCFKDRLLDTTGCIFGGAIVKDNEVLVNLFRRWGGLPEAPVFCHDFRAPVNNAVILNCVTARSNDFGNMYFHVHGERTPSHLGETLIPLGLTLADMHRTDGKSFITNNIVAEDLTARILYTFPVRWPADMELVSTGATALASRYYGLDAAETRAALSYAATNATDPANSYFDYSQEFKYHNGESARCAIMACELAKGGWTGLTDAFFGHWGLVVKRTGGELPPLYDYAVKDLGKNYFMEESFKQFPGGIPNTPVGLAALEVRKQMGDKVKPEDIKSVEVLRSENSAFNYYSQPFSSPTQLNALFCYQFLACCALYHGSVKVEHVQTEAIRSDTGLTTLIGKSTMGVYGSEDGTPLIKGMRVRVTMNSGSVYESTRNADESMHAYPTREFLVAKFMDQFTAFGRFSKARADKIIDLALSIENAKDMGEFTELLVP
ncbi:MAG TPA: MmgE/PrpD family protein [Syntrophorhabdaceae bacterium]|nr:MmgE/PrpD family protein [Syntrophorhabdaceae bacterium]